MDDLTCQELVELITDYLEGALMPTDRERFEAHLAQCVHCYTYLEQMRATIKLVGRLNEATIPTPIQAELLALFRDWKRHN